METSAQRAAAAKAAAEPAPLTGLAVWKVRWCSVPAAEVRGDVPKQQPCLRAAHVGGGGSRKNTHVVFPLRRTQCLILPLFQRLFFHYSISGCIGRLKEEVKEVKSAHSEVLSEKKKLQEQLGILQKVGWDFFSSRKPYGKR